MSRIQAAQKEDFELLPLIAYLDHQALPQDPIMVKKIVTQALKGYYLVDNILHFEDSVVPGR